MRIGECLKLTLDSMRELGQNQWAIRVPLGKLHTERWVPVDEDTCRIFRDILSLRSSGKLTQAVETSALLLQYKGRAVSYEIMRRELKAAAREAGCSVRPTLHQLRHSYATEMLRAGASLPVVKELLGHRSLEMTMRYVQVSQIDLQREYHRARQKMGEFHVIPKLTRPPVNPPLDALRQSLTDAGHLMEMYRRNLDNEKIKRKLLRLANRLAKICAELKLLDKAQQ